MATTKKTAKTTKPGATKKTTKPAKKSATVQSGQLDKEKAVIFHIADDVVQRKLSDLRDHERLAAVVPPQDDDSRAALTVSMTDRQAAGQQPILEPIVVTADGRIVDGMNRARVARALKLKTVPTRQIDAEDEDAIIEAGIMLNGARRQLTQDNRKAMAKALLEQDATWSNRHVARVVGLSPTTVGTIRDAIGAQSDVRKSSKGKTQKASSAKRRGPRNSGKGKSKKTEHPAISALRLLSSTEYDHKAAEDAFNGVNLSAVQLENLAHWADAMMQVSEVNGAK